MILIFNFYHNQCLRTTLKASLDNFSQYVLSAYVFTAHSLLSGQSKRFTEKSVIKRKEKEKKQEREKELRKCKKNGVHEFLTIYIEPFKAAIKVVFGREKKRKHEKYKIPIYFLKERAQSLDLDLEIYHVFLFI